MSVVPGAEAVDSYAGFAEYYDVGMNAALGQRKYEIFLAHGLIDIDRPDARSLLDLGTGTGSILAGFTDRMDGLTGVDISPEMLAVARQKVPEAEFVEADITDFELGREFDVAICLFDTLNHLRTFDKVESAFERAAHHLNEGGIFIFDVATAGLVQRATDREEPSTWPIEGGSYNVEVERTGGDHYVVNFAVKLDGTEDVATGSVHETVYPVEEIKAAADRHFECLGDFDSLPVGHVGAVAPASDDSIRPVFSYRKR